MAKSKQIHQYKLTLTEKEAAVLTGVLDTLWDYVSTPMIADVMEDISCAIDQDGDLCDHEAYIKACDEVNDLAPGEHDDETADEDDDDDDDDDEDDDDWDDDDDEDD